MKVWKVTRRYRVEDVIVVLAESATQARERVRNGDWEDATDATPISYAALVEAKPSEETPEELAKRLDPYQ